MNRPAAWLRARDPGLAATRRAARNALVMPSLFAICVEVLHKPATGTYAAFGSFAMLLLVDFTGPMIQRLRAHLALGVAWVVLVTLGSLAAHSVWTAALATVVVGFAILFAGVVSSVLAGATVSLLLGFVLPVTSPAPMSQLPDRLFGVGLATAAAMLAISLLWPRPAADPLRGPAAVVCRAAARQLRTDADHYAATAGVLSAASAGPTLPKCRKAAKDTEAATEALRRTFTATPYRPTGLSTGSRAVVRLVDELTWLSAILAVAGPATDDGPPGDAESCTVRRAAAKVLDLAADLLEDPRLTPEALRAAAAELSTALSDLENRATTRLPVRVDAAGNPCDDDVDMFIGSLDVSFRAQEVAFVALQVADNVALAASAEHRSWPERLLGREPGTLTDPLGSAAERARAHLEPHSVWLHNSIRGAVGIGVAVALADATGVQHAFWVILGALSVLRSNALNTGQNAVRAVGGTVVGSIIGAGLLQLVGGDTAVLWVLLPIAILCAGIVPAAISFAAGQAAFTVTLVILFSIVQPGGWSVALLRVEDIALGCAVSIVVGLLFWPRGASVAVDRALAEAYADSGRYLRGAVDFAVSCCTLSPSSTPVPQEGRLAAAAARRLDDAFRTYLAERGAKPVPLERMTTLVTGVVGLRLAADAVLDLWRRAADAPPADRAAAQQELRVMAERLAQWYDQLAASLEAERPLPEPLGRDLGSNSRLVEAVRRDLQDEEGRATATGVRVVWTGDHLEVARRLQHVLVAAAGAVV